MGFGRPPSHSQRTSYHRGGPPSWLVFLLGIALVFGVFLIWSGVRNFIKSGGLPIFESTEVAVVVATETAIQIQTRQMDNTTPFPTSTPFPECLDFIVNVPSAVVRERPSTASLALDSLNFGEVVCVIEPAAENPEWYRIDLNRATRRIEDAFMHSDIIEALNPTPTATQTFTPAPTVTPIPTSIPSDTPTPAPTRTPDPNATETPTLSPTPTPTTPLQSA